MQAEDLQIVERRQEDVESSQRPSRRVADSRSASALGTSNLVKSYGRRRVVENVSLYVDKGEVVGLLGANGAGKTTTFYMIVGLERPDAGTVNLGDRDVTGLPMYLRARLGIGYLPQEPSVFRKMTTEAARRVVGGIWYRKRTQHPRRRAFRRRETPN